MTMILAYSGLGLTRDITIQDANGATITPGANDKVRAIIGHEGQAAKLSVTSGTATAAGSSFTPNSPTSGKNRLRLDASDLAFDPGVYTLRIEYYDNADAQEWKTVDRQVFALEGGTAQILDVSELLLDVGLGDSATDKERALALQARDRAASAIARYLRYDPVKRTRTEYYPQTSYQRGSSVGVWDVSDSEAVLRRYVEGATSELMLRHIPVRSITSLAIDYDGRSGTKSGGFTDTRTEGTDFWPNYDGTDDDGAKICRDGILRSLGQWPTEPGSVKVVYVAGYSSDEMHGKKTLVDAGALSEVALVEAGRRLRSALIRGKKTGAGWLAGPITSESLGDYSYSIDASAANRLFGLGGGGDLLPESKEALQTFVNFGWMLAS